MSQVYSLCPQSAVYVLRVEFMSSEYSLCPKSTVYFLREQFMSFENSLCPYIIVYVIRVHLPSVQYISKSIRTVSPQIPVSVPQSTVYVQRVQFMSQIQFTVHI